ncbi:hypothetical protein HOC80_02950 [archaeon]|jgi:hypothetical protein|nr:hypothetical protein [archaeon]MBT4417037.1 hypothetical protein [archaeon]
MQYLIPIVAFLGLAAGILLKKTCKEEIKPGKPYFKILEKIILAIIIISIFHFNYTNDIYFYLLIIAGLGLGWLLSYNYLYFGIALTTLNPLTAVLIFIYGLPRGTLKPELKKNIVLFALPFLLLLINYNFTSVAIGALTSILIKKIKN